MSLVCKSILIVFHCNCIHIKNILNEAASTKPKYVRVNTLKKTVEEAIEAFTDEGWCLIKHSDKYDYDGFIQKVTALKDGEFMVDMHVPIHLLAPPPGSTVLDMCAAPGMKTTQFAAALANEGLVYAVERDSKRTGILKHIVGSTEATCVKIINKDVLDCSKKDFPAVEYILVDPSCSGSGMIERSTEAENKDFARLEKLAGFQILILRSALTRYPDAKRVAYSTCSLHPEENEDVVRQVLETNYNFKLVDAKKLLNSAWNSFGSSEYGELGEFCLYARPDEDLTNGFFVAIFERLQEGEQNPFFNNRISNFKKHLHAADKRKERKLEGRQNKEDRKLKRGKKNKEKSLLRDEPNNVGEVEVVEAVHERSLNDDIGFEKTPCEQSTKKKKKKKHVGNEVECQEAVISGDAIESSIVEKVDKKHKKEKGLSNNDATNDDITLKNKFRKNKYKNGSNLDESTEDTSKNDDTLESNNTIGQTKTKRKQIKHSIVPKEDVHIDGTSGDNDASVNVKSRKKKQKTCSDDNELIEGSKGDKPLNDIDNITADTKSKKKKHKISIEGSKNDERLERSDSIAEESKPKQKNHKSCTEVNELIEDLKNVEPLETSDITEKNKPKKKKRKSCTEGSNNDVPLESNDNIAEESKLKKRKHKCFTELSGLIEGSKNDERLGVNDNIAETSRPKKKKHKSSTEVNELIEGSKNDVPLESNDNIAEDSKPKRKKHKSFTELNELIEDSKNDERLGINDNIAETSKPKKKKHKSSTEVNELIEDSKNDVPLESNDNIAEDSKPKKKKHKSFTELNELIGGSKNDEHLGINDNIAEEIKPKKKKQTSFSELNELIECSKNDKRLGINDNIAETSKPKKKKHKSFTELNELIEGSKNNEPLESNDNIAEESKPRRKKHKRCSEVDKFMEGSKNDQLLENNDDTTVENIPEKKKPRHCSETGEMNTIQLKKKKRKNISN
nr:unnamed protein product [Callosobruchus analis]